MAPTTSAYQMADRLAGGRLAETIEFYRRAGVSWKALSRILREQFGIGVGSETLKAWAEELNRTSAA